MMYAIDAQKLTKKFKNNIAVNGINLRVEEGSIYGFLGPNGAGKTTAVKMLITLLSPTSGDAKILGKSITKDAEVARLTIGAALQEASLDNMQTGRELLRTQGALYGLSSAEISSRISELEGLIDIGTALDDLIKTYSGGMKRRVDLAAALIHNPSVLFLDEPTNGLDPASRNKIWAEIKKLNSDFGMTIFLTTQYLEEADELADIIGIINKGKIVAEDTPANLKMQIGSDVIVVELKSALKDTKKLEKITGVTSVKSRDRSLFIYAKNGGAVISNIVSTLDDFNATIVNVEIRKPTLDDVFLKVTEEE
ncbi:MAG: ATP-binding cassette domain-containing protein [Patescibacteria group bacterium]|nr:ATP-binding cassette domain-containing protein [Patescibacteria group bacterium]